MTDTVIEELTIRLEHGDLAARASGPTDGLPVLALHGWLDNAASFEALAGCLPSDWRFVALDLSGHGLSVWRPSGVPYHFTDWISEIFAVIDALGWQRCALVGHSMGAAIAMLCAATWSEKICSLALLDGIGVLTEPAECAPARLSRAIKAQTRFQQRPAQPNADFEQLIARMQQVLPHLDEQALRTLLHRGTQQLETGWIWRSDPRLRLSSASYFTEEHMLAFCRHIACPTVLVRAENGYPFDEELMRQRVSAVKDIVVKPIPGGHHVHMMDPEQAAAALIPTVLQGFAIH